MANGPTALPAHEQLHALAPDDLAGLLGRTATEARTWADRLEGELRPHVRVCSQDQVVVTDTGLLALWRVRELEALCLATEEILARLRHEAGMAKAAQGPIQGPASAPTNAATAAGKAPSPAAPSGAAAGGGGVGAESPSSPLRTRPLEPVGRYVGRAIVAGIAATGAFSIAGLAEPLIGLPAQNPPAMMASFLGETLGPPFGAAGVGWAMHFGIGLVLALVYAFGLARPMGGPSPASGALYGVLPWLVAMLAVMPVMGMGVFAANTGSATTALNSLLGHLIYGAVLGALSRPPTGTRPDELG